MIADIVRRSEERVPRYTSYPTAPHFNAGIDPETYAEWLGALPEDEPLSLYLHVPFCHELCLYCGCHTTVVRGYRPVSAYVDLLEREIGLVREQLGHSRPATHIHWGGGTPTILQPEDLLRITRELNASFAVGADAEIAFEIDPRTLDEAHVSALAECGMTRASLGVQDFDTKVQRAVNRIQSFEVTTRVARWLRAAGISGLNLDLMYGLPHQSEASVVRSVSRALELDPDRIALFGYAHVPWMKRHQSLLPEEHLPGAAARYQQMRIASDTITAAGYVPIGLDHFAKPTDTLARSLQNGELRRNFQGYTTDRTSTIIGLGTSSIGSLPQGYVQNAPRTVDYRNAIMAGRLATQRGIELSEEDRLRRAIIERLMCDLTVDVGCVAQEFGHDPSQFAPELSRIDELAEDDIAFRVGSRITVPDASRPLVRTVCAAFDQYLNTGAARHSSAV